MHEGDKQLKSKDKTEETQEKAWNKKKSKNHERSEGT
jgi:hypothetical protein